MKTSKNLITDLKKMEIYKLSKNLENSLKEV